MECISHFILMFEDKIHIRHGNKNTVFPETLACLCSQCHTLRFGAVDDHLKTSGIDELLNVLHTVNVTACTDFDFNITVDIEDNLYVALMLFICPGQVKNHDFINTAVIIEFCEFNDIRIFLVIVSGFDRFSIL